MKIQIRQNTFETNSSSMHSLVITNDDSQYTAEEIQNEFYCNDKGLISYRGKDIYFGRSPFQILTTFSQKLWYAIAALVEEYNDVTYKEIVNIIKKYIPTFKDFDNRDDYEVYKSFENEEEFIKYLEKLESKFGYKLHYYQNGFGTYIIRNYPHTGYSEDYGRFAKYLKDNNISIEEFLINKKYAIIVDGDEFCIWETLKEWPVINCKEIKQEIEF